MAPFYSVLRSASRRASPFAVRAIDSSAASYGETVAPNPIRNRLFLNSWRRCCSPPVQHFSTAVAAKKKKKQSSYDDHLIRIINSEIKCARESELHDCAVDIPDGLPFKVEDNVGERFIELKRGYQNEVIKIKVDLQNARCEAAYDDNDKDIEPQPSIPVVITVLKHNVSCLQFDAIVLPDRICIRGLKLKESESSETQLAYTGPDFSDLDESLQKCFQQYLEARGLTSSTAIFLLEYAISKETKEYLRWLGTLKKIIEI
ncbi:PREDICTED: uncharacterized protein At2g39795, mitochondrial-like [Ipomoea nil]|uniref:uncharacterized protein At2g39795, mitochondrial-like n=1 Tax=Ipomoea nil TaxID=35883 RepID=UPI0009015A34|nr:PREDICTED: uncharacterized protein At2g39795, mitochondrial-like [Ipomoea nil]XP_019162657.1 PREDICTED: uncharacterized protein At2g39795, mitochondrial-like [Ipomoea nil]